MEFHTIANTYPLMSEKEFNNLISAMEDQGFDEHFPIKCFEGKILDGRNRYLAACEAKVTPVFENFEGTFDEAVCESRRLNSCRRNLNKCQKAMVAAKDILQTRSSSGKNLSVKRASTLYDVSEGYIKLAMNITDEDTHLAEKVFEGKMSLREAEYRLGEIKRLRENTSDDYEHSHTEEHSVAKETASELAMAEKYENISFVISLEEENQHLKKVIALYETTCQSCDKRPSDFSPQK